MHFGTNALRQPEANKPPSACTKAATAHKTNTRAAFCHWHGLRRRRTHRRHPRFRTKRHPNPDAQNQLRAAQSLCNSSHCTENKQTSRVLSLARVTTAPNAHRPYPTIRAKRHPNSDARDQLRAARVGQHGTLRTAARKRNMFGTQSVLQCKATQHCSNTHRACSACAEATTAHADNCDNNWVSRDGYGRLVLLPNRTRAQLSSRRKEQLQRLESRPTCRI